MGDLAAIAKLSEVRLSKVGGRKQQQHKSVGKKEKKEEYYGAKVVSLQEHALNLHAHIIYK